MRKEDVLEAMSYIDEDYIMEARESGRQKRRHVFGTVAAALALSIILPNVSPGTAMAMANIPLIGKYFQVVTVRDFQYDENNKPVSYTHLVQVRKHAPLPGGQTAGGGAGVRRISFFM